MSGSAGPLNADGNCLWCTYARTLKYVLSTRPWYSTIRWPLPFVYDESDPTEQRFVVPGADAAGRVLVVVYSWREDDIRLISARTAELHEREEDEKQ